MKLGNKQNSLLNKEWGKHMRKWGKFFTNKIRRNKDKKIIKDQIEDGK